MVRMTHWLFGAILFGVSGCVGESDTAEVDVDEPESGLAVDAHVVLGDGAESDDLDGPEGAVEAFEEIGVSLPGADCSEPTPEPWKGRSSTQSGPGYGHSESDSSAEPQYDT